MSQPPDTPGRRSRRIEAQPRFNAHPKDIGTRTGAKMPVNISRDSMGFENADAFFMTPGGMTEAPGTTQTIRTFAGTATTLRSGASRMSMASVGTVMETPAPRGGRSRLAQLAADSEEEDGSGIGRDILNDDDGILDQHLSSPAAWYATNETPKVPLPPSSTLPPASPLIDYDNLPTPQKRNRKSKIGTLREAPSPAKSTYSGIGVSPAKSTTSSRQVMDELDIDMEMANLDDDDLAAGDMSMFSARSPSAKGTPAKKSRKSKATTIADDNEEEEEEEEEMVEEREVTPKPKQKGSKGKKAVVAEEDEEDDAGPSSRRVPAESQDVGLDQSFDMTQDDAGDFGGDDYANEAYNEAGVEDDDATGAAQEYDEDVSMEEAAIARENASGTDGEEDDRVVVKKIKSKTARTSPKLKAKRGQRSGSRPVEKRSRVSGIGRGEEESFVGDFTTRSGRKHLKPLEYWRGEKVNYGRGPGLAIIKEVVRIDPEPKGPLGQRKGRARSQSAKPKSDAGNDDEGWDDLTEPVGVVKEFATGREIQRRVAFPAHRLEPKQVQGSQFKYQKVFGEDQFIASGVVYIPKDSSKPAKQSKDNSYVFFVIAGAVQVTVHKTSFVVGPGGMFMVPRGNEYMIENVSEKEVQLFFAQARKIRMNEADEQAFEDLTEKSRARSASVVNGTPARRAANASDSDRSESDDE